MSLAHCNSRCSNGLRLATRSACTGTNNLVSSSPLGNRARAGQRGQLLSTATRPASLLPRQLPEVHRQWYSTRAKEDRIFDWVPTAYRGAPKKSQFAGGDRRPHYNKNKTGGGPSNQRGRHHSQKHQQKQYHLRNKVSRLRRKEVARLKAVKAEVQSDLDRFGILSSELRRILTKYRASLDPSVDTTGDHNANGSKLSAEAPPEVQTKKLRMMIQNLQENFEALENLDDPPLQLLIDSDDAFRALCRILQDHVQICCKSYRHESQREVVALIELAETCLHGLSDLRKMRAGFFDEVQKKENEENNVKQNEDETASSSWIAPLSNMASFITESIFSKLSQPKEEQKVDQALLAHQDKDLAPSQKSLRYVVESIVLATTSKNADLDQLEQRVVDLIGVLPEGVFPESRTMLSILEILCNTGTLEAAQECHHLFQKYSSEIPHLPFSLVLRSYLEASQGETTHERKRLAVKEVLKVSRLHWDTRLPRHEEELIAQGADVLHCIAVSGMSKDPEMKEAADMVVRRVLGDSAYQNFRKSATAVSGRVDGQYVPIVNFLACVYASSGDAGNINHAKTMINNLLPRGSDPQSRYIKYPNVETLNAVLEGILRLHQDSTDELDVNGDLVFVRSLIDFAMSRRESRIWTNAETFDLIMNLYTILKPPHVGELMEELVSHSETRAYVSTMVNTHISLPTYNRVIWGLWVEATLKEPRRTSQRALALLDKLEMMSTPFLLTDKQLREMKRVKLYDLALKPTAKTYELVLSVCADTADPSEYEMAAKVANAVGSRLLGIDGSKIRVVVVDKIQTCLDRLPPDSDLVEPTKKLVAELKAKASECQAKMQTTSVSSTDASEPDLPGSLDAAATGENDASEPDEDLSATANGDNGVTEPDAARDAKVAGENGTSEVDDDSAGSLDDTVTGENDMCDIQVTFAHLTPIAVFRDVLVEELRLMGADFDPERDGTKKTDLIKAFVKALGLKDSRGMTFQPKTQVLIDFAKRGNSLE